MANLSTVSADSEAVREGAANLPSNVADFTVEHVCAWLEGMDLGEYADVFRTNKIDGDLLAELEERDLLEDFGITNKYHRKKIMKRLQGH
ncbi:hypothetical protein GUITHDRAFT_155237 [Guillardia theta CCMP2712]|uniref:SAM domain-containing protein n=1 Tax=Guillardia theta (strain CCMP2712) TaxID=905079 RepID=L1IJQ5_GUITC|nr:hypothetical protein GUITHDRAFT_155237 [Guillardia theta CCMP2712]EKX36483.1 hypothetical protein GUITHDRAFT_155237 [Guillardia theta CCMP2712]|eukprot:XP_005823463.1 hypothetical protein GUITHDRAFT_155237 [Guillardia theta CCMP2712]